MGGQVININNYHSNIHVFYYNKISITERNKAIFNALNDWYVQASIVKCYDIQRLTPN